MNRGILGGVEWGLRFGVHYGILEGISTTIKEVNRGYKPLGVAIFLAVGGLLSGLLWSAVFVANPTGMVQERRVSDGSALIPQAQGAQIDSAALTPQSAPFLASADTETENIQPAENVDVLYSEGALKDFQPVQKIKTAASTHNTAKQLASGVIYTTVARDSLQSISITFGVPIDTIVEFNPSVNFSALVPGLSIIIPSQNDVAALSG